MQITFNQPKDVVVVKEIKTTLSAVTITHYMEFPDRKIVRAGTREMGDVVLWEGAAYDAIGQWTDSDVQARITELYNK